ncbi:MAG: glutathione synthase [Candidatus Caenarcaniphilales bacterium]|jgi:glutathione synthase|nr:glutathione synthase [Candidatus Caenarcaniphilales bacterium]
MAKFLFIADELSKFIKNHDSTWAMMLAAHELGNEVFYSKTLSVKAGQALALTQKLEREYFESQKNSPNTLLSKLESEAKAIEIDDFKNIYMRKDPPVNDAYITDCRILALAKKAKVINNPNSLINYNEKLAILQFPDLITSTMVTNDIESAKAFIKDVGTSVIKPLDGKAGEGVFVVEAHDKNLSSILETAMQIYRGINKPVMLQKYIPEIIQGDKRIILFNGRIAGALLRVPQRNDHRANLAAGGNFEKYILNKRDIEICEKLEDFLIDNGIAFAGIDVIGDYLTEINITSPTCLQEINLVNNLNNHEKLEYKFISATL